jgi:hypothetical protein
VARLHSGLEVDQLIEIWNLIYPRHRRVWYDEAEQRFYYSEKSEPLYSE